MVVGILIRRRRPRATDEDKKRVSSLQARGYRWAGAMVVFAQVVFVWGHTWNHAGGRQQAQLRAPALCCPRSSCAHATLRLARPPALADRAEAPGSCSTLPLLSAFTRLLQLPSEVVRLPLRVRRRSSELVRELLSAAERGESMASSRAVLSSSPSSSKKPTAAEAAKADTRSSSGEGSSGRGVGAAAAKAWSASGVRRELAPGGDGRCSGVGGGAGDSWHAVGQAGGWGATGAAGAAPAEGKLSHGESGMGLPGVWGLRGDMLARLALSPPRPLPLPQVRRMKYMGVQVAVSSSASTCAEGNVGWGGKQGQVDYKRGGAGAGGAGVELQEQAGTTPRAPARARQSARRPVGPARQGCHRQCSAHMEGLGL